MRGEDGKPLFWAQDDWRSRWLILEQGEVLHRIERIDVARAEWREEVTNAQGLATCGLEGDFGIPGIFSRMGCKRCASCCRELGIPQGDGVPGNCNFDEPGCEEPTQE